MLSDMNGLFEASQAEGAHRAATQSSVALPRLEALDRAAWRTRFRDPSELKRAADELAAAGDPTSLEAGLAALHYAWHCLALFDQDGAAKQCARATEIFERNGFGRGLDRLRAVKALILLRAGKSQSALDATFVQQHAADEDPFPEARYVALNIRALCYGDLGELDEAMRTFSAALTAARQTEIPVFEANALGNFG